MIDVSTPAAPVEVGSIDTPTRLQRCRGLGRLRVRRERACWSSGDRREHAVLASQRGLRRHPWRRLGCRCLGQPRLRGGRASGGLQVIDVSMPADPVIVGTVDLEGDPSHVAVSGGHAYVASDWGWSSCDRRADTIGSGGGGLRRHARLRQRCCGCRRPCLPRDRREGLQCRRRQPRRRRRSRSASVGTLGPAHDVAVSAASRMCRAIGGLQVVDVSVPVVPGRGGSPRRQRGGVTRSSGGAMMLRSRGDYAYIARTICGRFSCDVYLWVIDVSTPSAPVAVGSVGGWRGRGRGLRSRAATRTSSRTSTSRPSRAVFA